jgi:hypothetical protein
MRILSILLLVIFSYSAMSQIKSGFPLTKFDKVVIYDYESPRAGYPSIVDPKGQLTTSIKRQVQLDQSAIDEMNTKLIDKKSYGNNAAMCFTPHLGIVYYLQNRIVGHVSICLDCNILRSSFNIPAQNQNKVGEGDNAYYLGEGLSKSFRQFLNELLKKYNFSHQIKEGSAFDQ